MNETIRKFYQEYLEFQNVLEFRMFDLTKKINGRNIMISEYASNINEVEAIIEKYNNKKYIAYVGCNCRPNKVRVDGGVKYRRTFFFDIEASGEKPPLTDKIYYQKLLDTALYIWKELKKIKINPNLLLESGRGFHIGVKVIPLFSVIYDDRFKSWYKYFVKSLMKNRPHEDIKFNDSMVNLSRIESAPGFKHYKYPEAPERRILKLFTHQNNLLPFINRKRYVELKKQRFFPNHKKKYDDVSFYRSPEWMLLSENDDLPEGEIHTKLILQIKILARDNNLDIEKLQNKLMELGYNELVDEPSQDYQYSAWTLFNWAMKNCEYCVKRRIVLPFPFDEVRYIIKQIDESKSPIGKAFPVIPLNNFTDVLRYIRQFNKATAIREGEKIIIFKSILWKKIRAGIVNKYLLEYIEFLKLQEFTSGEVSTLDSDSFN